MIFDTDSAIKACEKSIISTHNEVDKARLSRLLMDFNISENLGCKSVNAPVNDFMLFGKEYMKGLN